MLSQKRIRIEDLSFEGETNTLSQKRTRIEDLSFVGEQLSEEHLRLVSGGMRSGTGPMCTWPGNMCDD